MIELFIKEGWQLNPNKKIVDAILKRCEKNNGECPCQNLGKTKEDRMCPCKSYRENGKCCCTLYVPIPITEEWLVNNGFEKFFDYICEFTYYTKEIDGNYIEIRMDCSNIDENHVVCHVDNSDRCSIGNADIQYVHQLQNFLAVLNIEMQ